jgi:hypothetical protein
MIKNVRVGEKRDTNKIEDESRSMKKRNNGEKNI